MSGVVLCVLAFVLSSFSDGVADIPGHMPLRGEGIKRVFWKKVLKAGLYVPTDVDSAVILGDYPKCIKVEYYVPVASRRLLSVISQKMKDNALPKSWDAFEPGLQRLSSILPDIHPGDSLAMCYEPSRGTSFIYNNSHRGLIAGDAFASVIFATWLGDDPVDAHLRGDLLGARAD